MHSRYKLPITKIPVRTFTGIFDCTFLDLDLERKLWYYIFRIWPYRLMARTPRFQCGNTGSIPVGATTKKLLGFWVKIWLAAHSAAHGFFGEWSLFFICERRWVKRKVGLFASESRSKYGEIDIYAIFSRHYRVWLCHAHNHTFTLSINFATMKSGSSK